tara:strand:+ start:736 stop:2331 length:1596 start_codon:yes stop_codon:yes gene_type:complete
MIRILIFLLVSIVFAQNKLNMPYDFSNHQGYLINNGNIVWNQDWQSGYFFFDGTFSNYPSTFGPDIESNYFNTTLDTAMSDSNYTLSYFDYMQGDYYLDNLDIGIEYSVDNKLARVHAFKKRYAGAYNQYTILSGPPNPIHYTYLGTYSTKGHRDKLDLSIGNFNSDFGLLDSLGTAFIDSRITSSNVSYTRKYDSTYFTINAHNFLQRYSSQHSEFSISGVRYLTRTKFTGSIIFVRKQNYNFLIIADVNKRSLRSNSFKSISWGSMKIGINHKNYSFNLGAASIKNIKNFIVDGKINYSRGPFLIRTDFSRYYKPSHISLLDSTSFEERDQLIFNGLWSLNKINIGAHIYFNSVERNIKGSQYNSLLLPDNSSNIWFYGFINYQAYDNLLLEFGYNKMNSNDYITDGIDERINIKLNNYFKLFSKVMTVYTSFTVSGFLDRDNDYVLHPIDQYPIKIDTDNLLKDIWLMNFSVSFRVKSLCVKYEMNNLTNIFYDYLGRDEQNNNIQFNPYFPNMRRLASLSIKWDFID